MGDGQRDGVARGVLEDAGLRVVVAVCTQAAREARDRHHLRPVSAALLAQGVAGAVLAAALQKGDTRLNLQLEVDGSLRGLFVDAGANGDVRGYVKNPDVDLELASGPFRWRPALGNSGFLSVLRDQGKGEFYRSSVELQHLDLALDLNYFFATSEQIPTRVALEVWRGAGEPLGAVAGVLVQVLPDGDAEQLEVVGRTLAEDLARAVAAKPDALPGELLEALFAGRGVGAVVSSPVAFRCSCSKARALDALAALGEKEVRSILEQDRKTAVTCQFCAARHDITTEDLTTLAAALSKPPPLKN